MVVRCRGTEAGTQQFFFRHRMDSQWKSLAVSGWTLQSGAAVVWFAVHEKWQNKWCSSVPIERTNTVQYLRRCDKECAPVPARVQSLIRAQLCCTHSGFSSSRSPDAHKNIFDIPVKMCAILCEPCPSEERGSNRLQKSALSHALHTRRNREHDTRTQGQNP